MGIILKAKQYLNTKASATTKKVADTVAKAASLSPSQLQQINQKREDFLSEKPNMSDKETQSFIERNLGATGIEVYQAYLEQLKTAYLPMSDNVSNINAYNRIRYFNVAKWVTDSEEKALDKLVNVYQVLSEEDCNIALIYHRTPICCQATIAVVNTEFEQPDPALAQSFYNRLVGAIKGNFPGAILEPCNGVGVPPCLSSAIQDGGTSVKSVAIVSNLASDKSDEFISQSMEKLLDGIVPESDDEAYTIVLLAKPITDQLAKRNRLFKLASFLSPYAAWQTGFTYSESAGGGSAATVGVNLGIGVGAHAGKSENTNVGVGAGGTANASISSGINSGFNASANFGVNFARTSNVTVQIGKNESITQSYTNYGVKYALTAIEKQLKRLDESSALGMWEFAAYIVAKSPVVANNVAHMYLALTQGDDSYMTKAAISLWDGEEESEQAETILQSIQKLQHPVFGLKATARDDEWLMYPTLVTPSAELTGKELAKALNFPRKSVSGLPVLEAVPFGREVQKNIDYTASERNKAVTLGNVYHMRHVEKNTVSLDVKDLTAHTFITGSTGAGKSNTIYKLLEGLCLKSDSVHFLVVEPAKGEYKTALGGYQSVSVYGTNPKKAPLLRMNPFSFPEDIHVLEHIDRLVEVFNACWPMYAAMPAVLKDAIEAAYLECGWNLTRSTCPSNRFPTFTDVLKQLPIIMNSSAYSSDTKGDYTGALVTRVKSLTNGINGQIFCSDDELAATDLFDTNVIIDLSRIGSTETKALLMGILMIKLQEHRMATAEGSNAELRHITVLEEAHNLLRRTSAEQSQESSNLQGKSVEMLANAIAEMRTYGEGFIIADQAPGLLDMSVIRNTNTKIIMRLPDESDRLLVGKAAGLNDSQIKELAKLDVGVAAVYQNHWLEPVLCKINRFTAEKAYTYRPQKTPQVLPPMEHLFQQITGRADSDRELSTEDVDYLENWLARLDAGTGVTSYLSDILHSGKGNQKADPEYMLYCIVKGKSLLERAERMPTAEAAQQMVDQHIQDTLHISQTLAEEVRKMIFHYVAEQMGDSLDRANRMLYYGGIVR